MDEMTLRRVYDAAKALVEVPREHENWRVEFWQRFYELEKVVQRVEGE